MTALPTHHLSEAQTRLLLHVAADTPARTIATDLALPLAPGAVTTAVDDLLTTTGTRTREQLAAWGTAQRIVTATTGPCAVLPAGLRLPPRLHRVLRGWVGGRTTPELAADLHLATHTVREYGRDLRTQLGVPNRIQASVLAVLAGLVLLSDVDPAWPAEPLARTAPQGRAA